MNDHTQAIPESMTIVGLEVDSYKRMRAAHLKPSPTGLIPVCGPNAAGKSSLIGAMTEALGIEKSKLPITEGEHAGGIRIDLGDLVVRCKLTRDSGGKAKRAIVVEGKDGGKLKSPGAVLESLRGHFADPIAFQSMSPADQVKTVLAITGLTDELARLEGIAEGHYDSRRDLGRDADRAKKVAEGLAARVRDLPPVPADGRTLEELTDQLEAAQRANASIAQTENMIAQMVEAGQRAAREVEATKKRLAEWEDEVKTCRDRWTEYTEDRRVLTPIEPAVIDEIRAAIAARESAHGGMAIREQFAAAEEAATVATTAHEDAEQSLEDVRSQINILLAGAEFPVDGLAYAPGKRARDGQLLFNGIPYPQASQAEQLKVAAAVAMAGNPAIKVIFAREGSLLDAESQRVLAEAADAAGFQLWLEVVANDPGNTGFGAGVWIEDGEAIDLASAIETASDADDEARTFAVPPRDEVAR